ncbi:hypothetical protein [uncultured Lactobacillus sp.]|uniref:pilin N-terminal domain-containing protein n=1 Tax=uncultured Lactobacillus sp. TaxID=153152 RepID=UPI002666832C|nr:hypothetical protein [uncultured Lactobacillus sp.]
MRFKSKVYRSLLALLEFFLALLMISPVQAADTGSLTVQMRDSSTGDPIPGGNLVIYQVAKLDSAQKKYQYTNEFAKMNSDISGMSQKEIMTADFARKLANYAEGKQISHQTSQISDSGDAAVSLESDAVYLVTQTVNATGYEQISPFCLILPYKVNGEEVNNIVAHPKNAKKTKSNPSTPSTPNHPKKSSKSSSSSSTRKGVPTKPKYPGQEQTSKHQSAKGSSTHGLVKTLPQTPRLPQTGQLNWPIPLLALAGLTLFIWGWVDQEKGKR